MPNYLVLGEVGTAEGPCSEHCSHLTCIMKRHDAESGCLGCGQPIGYAAEVYLTDYKDERGFVYPLARYWHRTCFEIHVSGVRQQLAREIAAGIDDLGVPMLESEIDEERRIAREMKAWQVGAITNDQLNALGWPGLPRVHPNATRFNTISSIERIEEARKTDGVRRRGRRRAFLPAREALAEEPPPDQEA